MKFKKKIMKIKIGLRLLKDNNGTNGEFINYYYYKIKFIAN